MPSSVIHHFHYDTANRCLRIYFVSGIAYDYKGVSLEMYEKFRTASSKGKFLNEEIKTKYPFERVEK